MTRAERFYFILTDLDDDLIEEAAQPQPIEAEIPASAAPGKVFYWKPWAALAACLLLVVGVWRFFPRMGSSEAPTEAKPPAQSQPLGNGSEAPSASADPGEHADGDPGKVDVGSSAPSESSPPQETEPSTGGVCGGAYDLTSGEITVYTPAPDVWLTTQVTDKAAKRLCTVLTISDPEPADPPGGVPIAWLDFGNGTVAAVFPGDYAVVYTCAETFSPDLQTALETQIQGTFPGLEDTLLQVLDDPGESWEP